MMYNMSKESFAGGLDVSYREALLAYWLPVGTRVGFCWQGTNYEVALGEVAQYP